MAGHVLMVSDGPALSTPQIVRALGKALGTKPILLPMPNSLMKILGILFFQSASVERLIGSLAVDDSETHQLLQWSPPFSLQEGLEQTVRRRETS